MIVKFIMESFLMQKYMIVVSIVTFCLLAASTAGANTYLAASAFEIGEKIKSLQAGDTLLIQTGSYDIGTLWLSGLRGESNSWIVVKGLNGVATLVGSQNENVLNLDGVSYVHFENIAITTNGAYSDIDGVTFRSNSHHVTFNHCRIFNVSGVGINSQVPEIHHIVVSNCEIDHCSEVGIYWGFNDPLKVARDCIIERSYIHHCPSDLSQATGYGIQIKGGSYRNIVRDNVLHDVGGTERAGIAVYYTNLSGGWASTENNIVSGNVVWNVSNEGIYTAAGSTLENNIVFDANVGLAIYPYTGSITENVIVRNNTIYRCRENGIFISGWEKAGNECYIINNASYMEAPSVDALTAKSRGNALFSGNVYYGSENGFGGGAIAGNAPPIDFLAAGLSVQVPDLDLYPTQNSPLINGGTALASFPTTDFNDMPRPANGKCDVGAYEYSGAANPGWRISTSFKNRIDDQTSVNPRGGSVLNVPSSPKVLRNWPNPFNRSTQIDFTVPGRETDILHVELQVFNVAGQIIKTLVDQPVSPGHYTVSWNGDDTDRKTLPAGVYFCKLTVARWSVIRKLLLF